MALNPCLSQESSSANELLYLALSSKTLLILKKFYESVEYVQEIRPNDPKSLEMGQDMSITRACGLGLWGALPPSN